MKFLRKIQHAPKTALSYAVKAATAVPVISFTQLVKDHTLTVSGIGLITTGAFYANPIAGFIVAGLLVLVFNERIA